MKLKNSYILLIAMSLFLLVSVGSVCASDATIDADVQLADDGFGDVLSDEPAENTEDSANSTDATPVKINTTVDSKDVRISQKETANIPVTVKDNESQQINITTGDLNVTENKNALKFNYVNSSIVLTDKLSAGNHNIVISFLGNANYSSSSKTIKLSVVGNNTLELPTTIEVNSADKKVTSTIKISNSVDTIKVDNKDNLKIVLSYKDGNKTINKTVENFELKDGTVYFNYTLDVKNCDVIFTYNYTEGNETLNKTVALKVVMDGKIIVLNNEAGYGSGKFQFKVVDVNGTPLANKTVSVSGYKNGTQIVWTTQGSGGSISMSTTKTFTSDENGIVTIENIDFYPGYIFSSIVNPTVGNYSITLSGTGDLKASNTTTLVINKADINIVIKPYKEYYGSSKKVIINVTDAKTHDPVHGAVLHLYMANTTQKDFYLITGENGISEINVSGLIPGEYPLTVSNNDTSNINNKTASGKVTILGIKVKMTVTVPKTYYYNSGNIATIKITNKATGKAVPNAIVLIQVYTGKKYQAYLYQANSKGIINVNYAPAAVGSHKIIVTMADSRYSASKVTKTVKVKKASAKISAPKVTAYRKDGKTFVIKLTNSKNKKAIYAAKLNVKIFISKNRYYNYNGQTGLDGKLRISLDTFKPGTYKVVVSKGESKNFAAKQVTSKFVIKKATAKITPTKLNVKENATKKTFKITVKNSKTKKAVVNLKLKVKVTGKTFSKTYTVKTNSKGIAQLNVTSLKVGSYKVVVTSTDKYVSAKSAKGLININK